MFRTAFAAGLAVLLASCASSERFGTTSSTSAPGGPTVISGSGSTSLASVAGPPGCAGPISEFQQLIDQDAESGHLNPGVYNRVVTDLEPVKRACAENREPDARGQLASVKSRYGYR
jgi:hypothetical protein